MKEAKVIKRYANRKLYDTERSCYVTLEEIAQMIKDGEDVQVVDNKSKDDLTAVTLAQIIVEEEKKVSRMPLKLLRSIIQSGNEALGDFYQKRVADPVQTLKGDVERRVENLFRRDGEPELHGEPEPRDEPEHHAGPEPAPQKAAPPEDASDGPSSTENGDNRHARPVREFVASTQEAFESWQRRIDERVKEALSRMTHLSHVGTDVEALRRRIHELESRLQDVEQHRNG